MPKQSGKLSYLLDKHTNRNINLEKQRKAERAAEKRKQGKALKNLENRLEQLGAVDGEDEDEDLNEERASESQEFEEFGNNGELVRKGNLPDSVDKEGDEGNDENALKNSPDAQRQDGTAIEDSADAASAAESQSEQDSEPDIPLSDLATPSPNRSDQASDAEDDDIIPHQRLTINNTAALNQALSRIRLPLDDLPFSHHQSITSTNPTASEIPDVDDDLARELAFYAQSLDAVQSARDMLVKETVGAKGSAKEAPFTRPADYFAEMVKGDEHMRRIKGKTLEEAAGKKASADAKRQRELKKFGKAVQVEKMKERAKGKKEMLEQVNLLKRKRKGAGISGGEDAGEGNFDVAVEEAKEAKEAERRGGGRAGGRAKTRDGAPSAKRQKKNEKFGFGGKKKYSKSGDAISSADMRGFSAKRMKAGTRPGKSGGGAKRLGKSRRAKLK